MTARFSNSGSTANARLPWYPPLSSVTQYLQDVSLLPLILPYFTNRFRTPGACFQPRLQVIALSGDRPGRLAPGEPSLWRILRERITVPDTTEPSVDQILHVGGQVWMGDAFEDARELLARRAMEPLLCPEGGWQEAQEEATERLREVEL